MCFLDVYKFLSATFAKTLRSWIDYYVCGWVCYIYEAYQCLSSKLAFVANAPLGKIKNKYLILSGTFVVGMMLKIVISSYAELILLLLASIYPVLISLGIRPITAVSVLSLITLDYCPKDGNSINMAKMVGEPDNVVGLFLNYQLWNVVAYVVIIALVIQLYYAYVDKRDRANSSAENVEVAEITNPQCPFFIFYCRGYLLCCYLGHIFAGIKLDVVSANFIAISFCFLIEFIRHRDGKRVSEDIVVVLKAMAEIFVSVVSIIIATSVFAEGIKALGGLEVIVGYLASMGNVAVLLCIIVLSFLVFGITIIMGSGIAAFSAIGNIAANLAPKLGIKPIILVTP
ncbi:C4-dicarboxylate transporter DcuC [Helicobacter cinaedi]|uniref:C4-dicarboxylate transporter DcuC n=1 Tax=Helicobacter cinaedi TaxID=213 RepID=UPI0010582CDC|nr:C4-dicarboxylate transporter DcuC [Helicobacter cinaedi]